MCVSKEMAVTLPLLIFCYAWVYRDKKRPLLPSLYIIGYIGVTAVYLYLRFYYFHYSSENIRAWEPIERALTIPWLIMNYLKLTLFPVQLSADYVISPVRSIFSISFLLPLIAVVSLATAALASEFWANSALFQCAISAYNLLKWMALLTGGVVRKWEIKTMRLWLIRIAGKLTKDGGQFILKLPRRFLHQEEWQLWERMSLNIF